jgi:hypothetical protein
MANSKVPQHKNLAMGKAVGFARGGRVNVTPVGAGAMVPSGKGSNPLTTAKRNNGIPGMKKGGKMPGC